MTTIHQIHTCLVLGLVLTAATLLAGCCGNPDNDVVVAKLTPTGALCWTKEFNCGGYTIIDAVTPTSDGGYIFSALMNGSTHRILGCRDGAVKWDVLGGASAIAQGNDGNILFIFDGGIDVVSPSGEPIVDHPVPELERPERPAGDVFARYPPSVIGTSDGGYAACGAFGVVKLDAYGNVMWKVPQPDVGGFTSLAEMEGEDLLATQSYYPGPITIRRIHAGNITEESVECSRSHSLEHSPVLKKETNGFFACYQGSPADIKRNVTLTPVEYYEMKTFGWICHRLNKEGKPQSDNHTVIPTTGPLAVTHNGEFFTAANIYKTTDELKVLKNTEPDLHAVKLDATGTILWETKVSITMDGGVKKIIATTDGGYVIIGLTQHHAVGGLSWLI